MSARQRPGAGPTARRSRARSSLARSRVAEQRDDGEGAEVRRRRTTAGRRGSRPCPTSFAATSADQQVAGVRDARVGEHPLQVRLRDADDGPEDHRRGRERPEHRRPVAAQRLERRQEHADERRERGGLDAGRHEAGHDGRRALVGVGRPHVERHGRHLEGEADEQQARAPRARAGESAPPRPRRMRRPGRACVLPVSAVGERDAVEEERARERAEQEVLERRLRARRPRRAGCRSARRPRATTPRARGR